MMSDYEVIFCPIDIQHDTGGGLYCVECKAETCTMDETAFMLLLDLED